MIASRGWPVGLVIAWLAVAASVAQEPSHHDHAGTAQAGGGVLRLLPGDSVTEHTIDLPSGALAYIATAGTFPLFDQSGEHKADVFYTSYQSKNEGGGRRPVTFAFNGGPGAASAFLHLGLAGPKIVDFGPDHNGAAVTLRDNPETWLAFSDLVLIDPIGTGWSRAAKPDEADSFYGVHADANALAKVIALYVAKHGRSAAPKYLLGESYGGFRSVKVARALQEQQGIIVSGLVMLSPLLEGAFLHGADRFALGAALQLPSLIASELERTHSFSAEALRAGEHFAMTDYLTTLAGSPPSGEAANAFYRRVAELTGMPVDTVARGKGFIDSRYVKHLRAAEKQVVSQYDVLFSAPDPEPESDASEAADPVLDGFVRALGGAFVGYAADQLGFKTEMTYTLLAHDVSRKWKWHEGNAMQPPSVTDDLRELLALDPALRCMIGQGFSDLVVPYSVARYVRDHLPQNGIAERVDLKLYRGGHMFYLDEMPRRAFTTDVKAFYGP